MPKFDVELSAVSAANRDKESVAISPEWILGFNEQSTKEGRGQILLKQASVSTVDNLAHIQIQVTVVASELHESYQIINLHADRIGATVMDELALLGSDERGQPFFVPPGTGEWDLYCEPAETENESRLAHDQLNTEGQSSPGL